PLRTAILRRRLSPWLTVETPVVGQPAYPPIRFRVHDRKRRLPLLHLEHRQRTTAIDGRDVEVVAAPEQRQLGEMHGAVEAAGPEIPHRGATDPGRAAVADQPVAADDADRNPGLEVGLGIALEPDVQRNRLTRLDLAQRLTGAIDGAQANHAHE